eukprot:m.141832 g.141832  ORF g.141832 m.141832 type:complete len:247 (-) comp16705_c2_seq5:710-1450(-)
MAGEYLMYDASTWEPWHYAAWVICLVGGLELMAFLVNRLEPLFQHIPEQGKRLEQLSKKDWAFIIFNKISTTVLSYHLVRFAWLSSNVTWRLEEISFYNTVVAFFLLYIVYDFFYVWFHWALHIQVLYPWVHKHHHRQVVPFRGNLDAVNVHPFEFVTGEYLHLLSMFIVPCHVLTAFVFVVLGGVLATLNHTRFDVHLSKLYMVKAHDVHHRIPRSNYGQYTMFWDRIFGFYREFTTKDKVKTED